MEISSDECVLEVVGDLLDFYPVLGTLDLPNLVDSASAYPAVCAVYVQEDQLNAAGLGGDCPLSES